MRIIILLGRGKNSKWARTAAVALCYEGCPEQERGVHFQKAEKKARYEQLKMRLTRRLETIDLKEISGR
jgi:hypothetical protein